MFTCCASKSDGEMLSLSFGFGQSSNTFYRISSFFKHEIYLFPRWKINWPQWIYLLLYSPPLKYLNLVLIPGAKLDVHWGTWTGRLDGCREYSRNFHDIDFNMSGWGLYVLNFLCYILSQLKWKDCMGFLRNKLNKWIVKLCILNGSSILFTRYEEAEASKIKSRNYGSN